MQETCNFDCLYAYLTCTNYDFRYDMSKGLRPRRQVRQAMAHEISMYGIVQKEKLGFDKAVEEWEQRNSHRQALAAQLEAERKRLRSKQQVRTHPSGAAGRRKAARVACAIIATGWRL